MKQCTECDKEIGRWSKTGMCQLHATITMLAIRNKDPEFIEKNKTMLQNLMRIILNYVRYAVRLVKIMGLVITIKITLET